MSPSPRSTAVAADLQRLLAGPSLRCTAPTMGLLAALCAADGGSGYGAPMESLAALPMAAGADQSEAVLSWSAEQLSYVMASRPRAGGTAEPPAAGLGAASGVAGSGAEPEVPVEQVARKRRSRWRGRRHTGGRSTKKVGRGGPLRARRNRRMCRIGTPLLPRARRPWLLRRAWKSSRCTP